ncbi:MAG: TonB-dependent receptor [Chlorobi bacterium]|nr:TonB-dependent receptor [Chlorobiota bacterium]
MKHIKLTISAIIIILFYADAYSQADTVYIEEILVSAKRSDDVIKTNINGKVLEIENPHDGGAMFKNQVGFSVEKRGNYGMEPVLRGFKYSQLNVQFDGGTHSANACPNRMDPAISQISPEEIEKIEIIKGPYNVRFGAVLGGIINIVSKRPNRKGGKPFSGSFDGGFQSNGGNYYSNVFAETVGKKYDFSVNAGYKDYGNYKSGSGQEIASSFTRWGFTVKAGMNIKQNQRLQFTLRQSSARDILYAGLPMDANKDNSTIASLDYGLGNLNKSVFSLKIKGYGSFVDHEMSNERRPAYKFTHAVSPVEAQVFGGRAELGLKMGSHNIMYAGLDFKQIAKQGYRDREVFINPCPPNQVFDPPKEFRDKTWQDSKKNDLGVFIENKYQLSEKLLWLVGLRIDYVSFSVNDPEADFLEQYNNDIQPGSRIDPAFTSSFTWSLAKEMNLQWAAARAVRSPDLSELFINHLSVGMDAYEYLGNPNLKSEVNYQTDVKIEKNWKNMTVFGDLFYSFLNNYITAKLDTSIARKYLKCKPPKGTKVFSNVDKAFMTGFEAGLDVVFLENFTYSFGAAYTYAQNTSWDEPLSEIPPFTINTFLAYKVSKVNTRVHARIASEQGRVSTSFMESATPGFTVLDFYFTYSPWEFMDVSMAVTNIFDENYVEHLSRAYKAMDTQSLYYEPGRGFNLGVKFMF